MKEKLSIEQIDPNFAAAPIDCSDMEFYNPRKAPMRIYGLYQPEVPGQFHRFPPEIAEQVSPGVQTLNWHTSGGRIRFKTDAKRIIVKSVLNAIGFMSIMSLSGTSCFDLYADGEYIKSLIPPINIFDNKTYGEQTDRGFYSAHAFPDAKMREIEIGFPLYNPVVDVFVGLSKGAQVLPPEPYKIELPVVFYGSSITQGGCASHAGNSYQGILSRRLNFDYINLGFSGNAKGEQVMAEYIAGLKMSAFVFDYDHNTPSPEHFLATHEPFFRTVRQAQPDLPIIMVSAADWGPRSIPQRREIILQTYQNALAAGDKNVYFVDGDHIYDEVGIDLCTVDRCHPNDLGFWCMANAIGKPLAEILKK